MLTRHHISLFFITALAATLISCGSGTHSDDESRLPNGTAADNAATPQDAVRPAEVTIMQLARDDFNHEIISNGKLTAAEAVDLYFRSAEIIDAIPVRNGQRVTRGQTLARLDQSRLRNSQIQLRNALAQADLTLKDILIGQGYNPDDTTSIPDEVMTLARTKSGIESARASLRSAQLDLEAATLTAPVPGVVANIEMKKFNQASPSEPFCRIINDASMEVEFPVMESELPLVKPGNKILISTYSSTEQIPGTITAVNPVVEKNGMIKVWGRADRTSAGFIDGMNVRVRIRKTIPDQIVVPKSAVVLRSDRQVVFSYDGNGRAQWNYVTTGFENLDQYTITEGLTPGMEIITSGNVNLAHESPVTVMNPAK